MSNRPPPHRHRNHHHSTHNRHHSAALPRHSNLSDSETYPTPSEMDILDGLPPYHTDNRPYPTARRPHLLIPNNEPPTTHTASGPTSDPYSHERFPRQQHHSRRIHPPNPTWVPPPLPSRHARLPQTYSPPSSSEATSSSTTTSYSSEEEEEEEYTTAPPSARNPSTFIDSAYGAGHGRGSAGHHCFRRHRDLPHRYYRSGHGGEGSGAEYISDDGYDYGYDYVDYDEEEADLSGERDGRGPVWDRRGLRGPGGYGRGGLGGRLGERFGGGRGRGEGGGWCYGDGYAGW